MPITSSFTSLGPFSLECTRQSPSLFILHVTAPMASPGLRTVSWLVFLPLIFPPFQSLPQTTARLSFLERPPFSTTNLLLSHESQILIASWAPEEPLPSLCPTAVPSVHSVTPSSSRPRSSLLTAPFAPVAVPIWNAVSPFYSNPAHPRSSALRLYQRSPRFPLGFHPNHEPQSALWRLDCCIPRRCYAGGAFC